MALTNKQKAFIEEYLACWNATQAAIKAGYSEKTARSIGHENLTKPDIQKEIELRVAEKVMCANEVLERLSRQARFNLGEYMEGNKVDLEKVKAAGYGHLLKSVKARQFGYDIEFESPFEALQLIGKTYGLFVDKGEVSGELTVRVIYADS